MNPRFPCDHHHGAATHSCIMHNTGRGTFCKNATGFGSEFASRCSDVCTKWLLNTCLPTAIPSPASLAVTTCDRLTVVISISHVWNLLRTEDVHLHTPALRIGTHFLLPLVTVVFLFHLLSTTSKPFSSLSTRLAHAVRLGFFYKNALYKFTAGPLSIRTSATTYCLCEKELE